MSVRAVTYWATSAGTMRAIARVDPEVAAAAFGNERAIALGGWPGALRGRAWASLAGFERELASGTIEPGMRVAMYDPERWRHTPVEEQRDPIGAIRRFVALARERGFVTMVTPYPRLVTVPGSVCRAEPGESEEAAYLRHRIAAVAAEADVCETQAQRSQNDPGAYHRFVAATAEQAREANPRTIVLSGLSTSPGFPATPEMLFAAWERVREVVDGHYLSLSKGRYPEVMAAFLRRVLLDGD